MRDFRDLIVWQKAMGLFEGVVKDVEKFSEKQRARRTRRKQIKWAPA